MNNTGHKNNRIYNIHVHVQQIISCIVDALKGYKKIHCTKFKNTVHQSHLILFLWSCSTRLVLILLYDKMRVWLDSVWLLVAHSQLLDHYYNNFIEIAVKFKLSLTLSITKPFSEDRAELTFKFAYGEST